MVLGICVSFYGFCIAKRQEKNGLKIKMVFVVFLKSNYNYSFFLINITFIFIKLKRNIY